MSDDDIMVTSVARTPFGRFGGSLKSIPMASLAALAMNEALVRSQIQVGDIDAAYIGCGMIGAATLTPARQAVLISALSENTPSLTVDRACCSGMTAIGLGWKDIRVGAAHAILCGGADNLSATPLLMPRDRDKLVGPMKIDDPLLLRASIIDRSIACYTSEEALRHGIDRQAQDDWALASHQKYFSSERTGFFTFERFAVKLPQAKGPVQVFATDESPRADTSSEKLRLLEVVYGSESITPGNSPGLNDGSAFIVLARRDWARERNLPMLARLVDYVQVADGPTSGSFNPAIGIERLLQRNYLLPHNLDAIEINEAFAAPPLVSTLHLTDGDKTHAKKLRERTNCNGGAVAIGHPLGASGARLVMTLVNSLRQRGGGLGVAAICGGFGQGDAVLLEVDDAI